MSLDVYLEEPDANGPTGSGIFVREAGQRREISREEWNRLHPGQEPVVATIEGREVYEANITHNLNRMAEEAGIYKALWRPEEIGITKAQQLVEPLTAGLALLRSDPARFEKLNPDNGWGDYAGLVGFVSRYLEACKAHPNAEVKVSR